MNKNQYYIDILEEFIVYYKNICNEYIINHKTEFSSFYLHKWYNSIGRPELDTISSLICQIPLSKKTESFVRSWKKCINTALSKNDDTLILKKLFAVPKEMRKLFYKNGTNYKTI